MSGIGSAGFGPGINPYAGNLNSTKGTDAARANSTDRSTAADHASFSENLAGAGETERSGDRDADAFFTASGQSNDGESGSDETSETADGETSANAITKPAAIDQPLDDHRGNMINFDA
ncbi:MAG: hypothetical protein O3B13_07910 [Planctomycetota bacterium]|nr:hypothetical protein [Planctomycetota bacterium]MDA1163010.1 hypothetical protein [Planctomycetota bacterium]